MRQNILDLVAPELYAERNNVVLEPLLALKVLAEPLIEEAFGNGKHEPTAILLFIPP